MSSTRYGLQDYSGPGHRRHLGSAYTTTSLRVNNDQETDSKGSSGNTFDRWPKHSKFFDPDCHDDSHLKELLEETEYDLAASSRVACIEISSRVVSRDFGCPASDPSLIVRTDDEVTIMFIKKNRAFENNRSTNWVNLDKRSWLHIVAEQDVMPSFLDVLHSNNGAFSSHVSYGHEDAADATSSPEPTAMHIMLKFGNWQDVEHAVYARYDFKSKKTLILVLGTANYGLMETLYESLKGGGSYDIFRIFNFQTGLDPLPLQELSLSKDLHITAQVISNVMYGSSLLRQSLLFLDDCIIEFNDLNQSVSDRETQLSIPHRNLRSAIKLYLSLVRTQYAQLQELLGRVNSQIEITKALVVQRDVEVNIDIAKAVARYSKVMKANAIVTTLFPPMTAFATFFSMVFFRVLDDDGGRFVVNKHIYLQLATFIPITALMLGVFLWWITRTAGRQNELTTERSPTGKKWSLGRKREEA